jgi:hypothetical protein
MSDSCGVGARACPIPARPAPHSGRWHEARRHGVLFDVANDFVELGGVANPAVPGFLPPEGLTGEFQNLVGFVSGRALQPTRHRGERHLWRDQQVDMVWHDHPGVKFVKPPVCLSCRDGFGNYRCDTYIPQPARPRRVAVQPSIRADERVSGSRVRFQDRLLFADGNRSVQAPRHEYWVAFDVDVRELSSVDEHLGVGRRERLPHISGNSQRKSLV